MTAIKRVQLAAGLYFIATPIGTARDITLRALDILTSADVIAAEDTRSLRKLMDIHGVALEGRTIISYHDHNGPAQRPRLLAALEAGKSVAYASEAGTPLVADPGYQLGRAVVEAGHTVLAAPGPSAVLAALTVSGLPSDRFLFAGFAPNAKGARRSFLQEFSDVAATLVFYESPKRIAKMLNDAAEVLGAERQAVVARELTKKFEEIRRGTLAELAEDLSNNPVKGEIVLLINRGEKRKVTSEDVHEMLTHALQTMSKKDAVASVASAAELPRREVYQMALKMDDV
ncbi:MAG: 16S rRNA (cytidine(1402)-2'-O)-methyltransferase [Litoreibacter sp.]